MAREIEPSPKPLQLSLGRQAGLIYDDISQYRHQDSLTRIVVTGKRDCSLCPETGKLCELTISATSDVRNGPANVTWQRTGIRNAVPWAYRLALWPLGHTELEA